MDSQVEEGCTHQFLVKWRDSQTGGVRFLGQLSGSPPEMGSLFLYFGYDRAGKRFLMNFHLQLKINAASKGVRNFFLVPPVKDLEMEVANPLSEVNTAEYDPQAAREFQKAGMDSSSKTFCLLFSLKEPGYVTMPLQGFSKAMSTKSKGLLLSLRSLSRAMDFEIYLPYSGEEHLKPFRDCSEMLRQEELEMPSVDYNAAYHGRAWGRNEWSVYHLEAEETLQAMWNPIVDDSPPSYEEAVQSSSPSSPGALRSKSDRRGIQMEGQSKAVIPEKHVTPPALPDSGTCVFTAAGEQRGRGGRKRKAEAVPLGDRCSEHIVHPRTQWDGEKPTQSSVGQPTAPVSQRAPSGFQSASIPQNSVINGGPNRRFFDDVQYNCFRDAVAWLKAAWYIQSDAHEAFLPELGMLAQAAREHDLVRYEHTRVDCMYMLCRRERSSGSSTPVHGKLSVDDRVWHIIDFVNREVGAGSDIVILDELIALSDVARAWKQVDRLSRNDEWQHWQLIFTTQMAVCILVALYRDEREWLDPITIQTI